MRHTPKRRTETYFVEVVEPGGIWWDIDHRCWFDLNADSPDGTRHFGSYRAVAGTAKLMRALGRLERILPPGSVIDVSWRDRHDGRSRGHERERFVEYRTGRGFQVPSVARAEVAESTTPGLKPRGLLDPAKPREQ